jgi:prepilin-type N-terminal cleavage/methylation domain-containing protein
MTGNTKFAAAAKRNADGFTLLELVTVVAILGILAAMATPSMVRMLQQQETKSSAAAMAGLLSDARERAVTEGTPHLVYFNPPSVDGNGECGAAAVEVRDADHSYSITPGDDTKEFHLPASACKKVTPYGDGGSAEAVPDVPMPGDDLAVRAPDTGVVAAVGSAPSAAAASGSSGSTPSSSGSGSAAVSRSAVSETVVNGATFPVDPVSGRPVVAFSERGIPVDPSNPNAWGTGAGGIYLSDGASAVYAALVQPLGDVQLRAFDRASGSWK